MISIIKNISISQLRTLFTVIIVSTLLTFKVNAITITSIASGNWNSVATWDLGVPTAGDDVIIAGFTVTANTNQTCRSITLNSAITRSNLQVTANTLTIATDLNLIQNSGSSDIRFHINNSGVVNIGGNLIANQSNADDIEIYLNNVSGSTAQLNIANSLLVTKTGGDDFRIRLNGSSSLLNISNNCILTHNQGSGDRLDIDLNAGSFNVANNLNLNISGDAQRIYFDLDGGMLSTMNINIANNCTNIDGDILIYVDQSSNFVVFNDLNATMAGGDDFRIYVNQSAGTTGQFTVNNNFNLTKTSDAGDDFVVIVDDASSSLVVGGNFISNFNGTSDVFRLNLDGGTTAITGDFSINAAGSCGNIHFDLDGGNFIVNDFTCNYNGNSDALISIDQSSIFSVNGNFSGSLSGGDDFLLYVNQYNGTNAQFNVLGDFSFNKAGDAGDNFVIIIDDVSSVFNVSGNFFSNFNGATDLFLFNIDEGNFTVVNDMVISMGTGTGNLFYDVDGGAFNVRDLTITYNGAADLLVRMDNDGIINSRNFSSTFNTGDDFDLRLNNNLGTNAQLNISGNFNLTHQGLGDDSRFYLNQAASVIIDGDFTVNNNASSGDFFELQLANGANTMTIGGNMTLNLNSGAIATADDIVIDMNGGALSIAGNALFLANAGDDVNIQLDNSASMAISGNLTLNNDGGDLAYILLNRSAGTSATINVNGNIILNHTSGTRTEIELNQNSIATVVGDITFNAPAAGGLAIIDMDDNARLNIGGNFLRPSGFGLLDAQVNETEVNYNGSSSAQTWVTDMAENFRYRHVLFNNTSGNGVTLGANITGTNISGNVRAQSGLALTGGFLTSMNATSTFEIANGAIWETTTIGATGGISVGGFQEIRINSLIHFSGDNQTVPVLLANPSSLLQDYGILRISGTGTKTLAGNESVVNNLEMVASIFDITILTLDGSGGIISTGGDLQMAKLSTILPELTGVYSMTGGTTTFNGTGDQIIKSESFFNILATGSGIKTPSGIINVNGDLTINSELDVTTSNFNIDLAGNWNNNGVFSARNGLINLDGTSSQSINGNTDFFDVSLNNSSGAIISSGTSNLIGTLTLTNGNLNANNNLILISDALGTARIAEITGGSISGNMTMQRYIDAGSTDWRFLTSAVSGTTLSDFNDDFITSGFTGSDFPLWPTVANPWQSIYFYDETHAGIIDNGFTPASNISNSVRVGEGIWVWSGDTITGTQPFMIDMIGVANTGTINLPVSYTNSGSPLDDGWNMVGNPYPSTIDWDDPSVTKTNINNAIYIWNPDLQQFASYVFGIGTNGGSRYIASSQAFWVQSNSPSPLLQVTESCKTANGGGFLKPSNATNLNIMVTNNYGTDETIINFEPNATLGFDGLYDALKMTSPSAGLPNISTVLNDSIDFSINQLPEQGVEIPLKVITGSSGLHIISFVGLTNFSDAACIIVEDLFTGNSYDLKVVSSFTAYISDTTNVPRFLIKFGFNASLSSTDISCFGNNDGKIRMDKDGPTFDIVWKNNQGVIIASSTNVLGADSINNLSPGNYVAETNDMTCGNLSETITINEPTQILAEFSTTSDTVYLTNGGFVNLTNTSLNANYYYWNFGDGNYSSISSPTHQYLQTGNYSITLSAYQNSSCYKTFTKDIVVINTSTSIKELIQKNTKIYINNNLLLVDGSNIQEVEVRNIIGQLLYRSINNKNRHIINLDKICSQTLLIKVLTKNQPLTTKINYIKH